MQHDINLQPDSRLKKINSVFESRTVEQVDSNLRNTQRVYLNMLWQCLKLVSPSLLDDQFKIVNALIIKDEPYQYLDLLNSLATLGLQVTRLASLDTLMVAAKPCICVNKKTADVKLVYFENDNIIFYDPKTNQHDVVDKSINFARYYWLGIEDESVANISKETDSESQQKWFTGVLHRFLPLFASIILISIFLHLLSLAIPIYIIYSYIGLINSGDASALLPITMGVIIVLLIDQLLRLIRARTVAWIGSRVDYIITNEVFAKAAMLPINILENTPISAQIARIKSFSSLRDFFTSAIFTNLMELPSIILMLGILSLFHIYYTVVTLFVFAAYVGVISVFSYFARKQIQLTATYATKLNQYLINYYEGVHTMRKYNLSSMYKRRIAELSTETQFYQFVSSILSVLVDNLGRAISGLGVLSIFCVGTWLVWHEKIVIANLLGATFIVWRIFIPAQVLCSTVVRSEKIVKTIRQVNNYMSVVNESDKTTEIQRIINLKGKIEFKNVGIHFSGDTKLAIRNFSLCINPGELVVISGDSGSGKSILLKMLLVAYRPSIGTIYVDDHNITQFNRHDLRRFITYIPQSIPYIRGTIYENMTISNPFLSREQAIDILKHIDLYDDIIKLPNYIDTEINAEKGLIPRSILQKLNLCFLYAKNTPIKIIDSGTLEIFPSSFMRKFTDDIQQWKNKSTTIIISNNEEIQRLADKVVIMKANSEYKIYEQKN